MIDRWSTAVDMQVGRYIRWATSVSYSISSELNSLPNHNAAPQLNYGLVYKLPTINRYNIVLWMISLMTLHEYIRLRFAAVISPNS
jgi:hypothetical protein